MEPSFSLKVLDQSGKLRTVENVMWDTTAKELLKRLLPSSASLSRVSLVEIWHECFKRIPMEKTLSSVIREWSYMNLSGDDVRLAMIKNPKWRLEHDYMMRRRRHAHVRARHNRKYHIRRSKVSLANAISNVARKIVEEKRALDALLNPSSFRETASIPIDHLPDSQREQGKALMEAIEEEKREKEGFNQRKKELSIKIASKERALEKAKKKVSDLNAQVLNEQYKLKNLNETKHGPEIEKLNKEIAQLKEEVSVRSKLNKLQLSKMNELTEAVLQAEEELKACDSELKELKL